MTLIESDQRMVNGIPVLYVRFFTKKDGEAIDGAGAETNEVTTDAARVIPNN